MKHPQLPPPPDGFLMPVPHVRRVENNQVYFAVVNTTHGYPFYDAFVWDMTTDAVTPAPVWGHVNFADDIETANGHEFAYVYMNESLPVLTPPIDVLYPANTVVVQRDGGEPQTVYVNTEEFVVDVRYINDGNALAVALMTLTGTPENPPIIQTLRWVKVTRDGTVTELVPPILGGWSRMLVEPIPDGYVVFNGMYGVENSLNAVTSQGTTRLWTSKPDKPQFELLHATPPDLSSVTLPIFTPIDIP